MNGRRFRRAGFSGFSAWLVAAAIASSVHGATAAKTPEALPSSGRTLAVALQPSTLAVGDPVEATLTLSLPIAEQDRDVTFPDWSKGWGEAEVLEASPVEKTVGGTEVRFVQKLRLTAWKAGPTPLPQVAARLGGSANERASTPESLALDVRSVLAPDDKELRPAPPATPRSLSVPESFWWTLGVGGLLLVAAAILAWRQRRDVDPLAAPQLAPLAELERALGLLGAERPELVFAPLSRAVRRYLGRRLSFRALESTTTEVQKRLTGLRLEVPLVQRTVRLLRLSDQIKFAGKGVTSAEAAQRISEARQIAEEIETHLAPSEATPAPEENLQRAEGS